MLKKLDDKNFESFIGGSFYSTVGFYYPSVENEDKMLEVIEEFSKTHANVACGTMDIIGQEVPDEYGIGKDESPVIVVFKQGNAIKAVTDFSVKNIEAAITPPGKNITLQ
ncbi:hypothetical protein Ccar_01960 [Clostridium carboxidivorans P7]|uniref:Uncharacterized protein n=1 Tax=Clostridium carboxidivorans P7 TaxID=536227 RepID=C6PYJ3_9CLOT|nr:hypothetical protein [Clostridium carboxidivorans]AKN29677.1 hypothetical protein Ccar_01960 [Clostridium carboxidivorans P7]EET85673.1 hypothetical protein CcarbDRAFT_3860 [Clostridium carboxidivorans P7]EFG89388.1 hypothetical protein CLCAR_0543 [Clostridium carboxidivorans P7]